MTYVERRDDLVWAFAALLTLICAGLLWGYPTSEQATGVLATLSILAFITLSMSRLTVRFSEDGLQLALGWGFFGQCISREAITEVAVVPPPSPFGVGVRPLSDGWLYSLGRTGSYVEVRLGDGRRFLIGSNDAEQLAEQIWAFSQK